MRNKQAIRYLLRRYLFLPVCTFLIVFLAVPFWSILRMSEYTDVLERMTEMWTAEEVRLFITRQVGSSCLYGAGSLEMTTAFFIGIGFMSALALFAHLHSRRQSMLEASRPVSPAQDFAHRSAVFALCVLPAAALALAVLPLVTIPAGVFGLVDWSGIVCRMGMQLLLMVYGFSVGALAAVLTGKLYAAILGGLVLGLSGEAVSGFVWALARKYLVTMPEGVHYGELFRFCPTYAMYKNFYKPGAVSLLPGLLAILVSLGFAFWLYGQRRVERAGKTIAFPMAEHILEFYLPLMGGLIGAETFAEMYGKEALAFGMGIAGVVLTWGVCRVLFTMRWKALLRTPGLALLPVAALLLICAGLHMDVTGYDRYLPEMDKLDAMTIRAIGENYEYEEVKLLPDGTLPAGYAWAERMAKQAEEMRGFGADFKDSVIIRYHAGGKTVSRQYPLLRGTQEQPMIREILGGKEYRAFQMGGERMDAFRAGVASGEGYLAVEVNMNCVVWIDDPALLARFGLDSSSFSESVPRAKAEDVLLAMEHDVARRTPDDVQGRAIAQVTFTVSDSNSNWHSVSRSLYPCDKEMLSLIYGERAEAILDFVRTGWLESDDVVMLRETRNDEEGLITAVAAVSGEEARRVAGTGITNSRHFWNKPEMQEDVDYAIISRNQFEKNFGVRFETGEEYAAYITENGLENTYPSNEKLFVTK